MTTTLLGGHHPPGDGRQKLPAIQSRVGELSNLLAGDLRVAMGDSVGLQVLAPYARRFLERYPAGRVYLEYRGPEQVYEAVLGNRATLGLVAYPRRGRNLEVVPLGEEPLVLACHPRHPFAEYKSIKLTVLKAQELLSFQPDLTSGKALAELLKRQGLPLRRIRECGDIERLKTAVKSRFEVAIVPEGVIRHEVDRKTLVAVKIEEGYGRPLGAIYRKKKGLSPALARFLALLKKPLGGHTKRWR